jgi:hypothetical protein
MKALFLLLALTGCVTFEPSTPMPDRGPSSTPGQWKQYCEIEPEDPACLWY